MSNVDKKINLADRLSAGARRIAAVAGLATLLVSAGSAAHAATNSSASAGLTATAVGSVDIQKVVNGYTKKAATENDMKGLVDQYNSAFTVQKANAMLSTADQQSLGNLLLKPSRTPADDAQVRALEAKAQADASELANLQQKPSPTDADKARLAALTQEQQAGADALQTVHDNYSQLIDARNQQQSQQLVNEVRAAVAAVAQQRGLAVVFDSSTAIYASNDITQQVINRLNSGK